MKFVYDICPKVRDVTLVTVRGLSGALFCYHNLSFPHGHAIGWESLSNVLADVCLSQSKMGLTQPCILSRLEFNLHVPASVSCARLRNFCYTLYSTVVVCTGDSRNIHALSMHYCEPDCISQPVDQNASAQVRNWKGPLLGRLSPIYGCRQFVNSCLSHAPHGCPPVIGSFFFEAQCLQYYSAACQPNQKREWLSPCLCGG